MRVPVLSRKRHTPGSSCPDSLTPSSWRKGFLFVLQQPDAQPNAARDKAPRVRDRSNGGGYRSPGTGDGVLASVTLFFLGDSRALHHAGESSARAATFSPDARKAA